MLVFSQTLYFLKFKCLAANEIIRRVSKDKFEEALNIRLDYEYEY